MKQGLLEHLQNYSESDFYPFHMPGHKRNIENGPLAEIYQYDITEIDGFDNLHKPESIIKDAEERAAKLYHSEETFFLVNGSTAGILSAISAIAGRAKKLIIARNCHKAVYHAAFLNRMELHYVYPEILGAYDMAGAVLVNNLKSEIDSILDFAKGEPERASELIAGVVITSPTYDGIISGIKEIADLVHAYGIPLIVDQAHGAHFGIHPAYPESAVREGADIVIHSVHKMLPAPTQTALIHRNGTLVDKVKLRKYLQIYQSSSPSYILMAGMDEAIRITKEEGYCRLEHLLQLRQSFLKGMGKCRHIRVCPLTEPGKLVISVKDSSMTGQMLYDTLREKYHLQMEMASGSYVVAILSMMDKEEGFDRLLGALLEIDQMISEQGHSELFWYDLRPGTGLDIENAYMAPYEEIELNKANGKIVAEFINLYPPGIPLLVPGEILDDKIIKIIQLYLENDYNVQGIFNHKIRAVKTPE